MRISNAFFAIENTGHTIHHASDEDITPTTMPVVAVVAMVVAVAGHPWDKKSDRLQRTSRGTKSPPMIPDIIRPVNGGKALRKLPAMTAAMMPIVPREPPQTW
mmetsp:Transcript_3710/g.6867  ORF Transcript_3710/g.6867 Transcript_3710/m.6867 type:complete len:103 (+) Transcript_3710:1089-1397(+)